MVRDRRVIELGCGVGIPGLFSSTLSASTVLLTERPHAIQFIRQQINLNAVVCKNVTTIPLEWSIDDSDIYTRPPFDKPFDVVLCSDLIYAGDAKTTTSLVYTIRNLTHGLENSIVISAFELRHIGVFSGSTNSSESQDQLFTTLLSSVCGFKSVESVPLQSMDRECRDESILIKIYRKLSP